MQPRNGAKERPRVRSPVWPFSSAPFRGYRTRCQIPSARALGYPSAAPAGARSTPFRGLGVHGTFSPPVLWRISGATTRMSRTRVPIAVQPPNRDLLECGGAISADAPPDEAPRAFPLVAKAGLPDYAKADCDPLWEPAQNLSGACPAVAPSGSCPRRQEFRCPRFCTRSW